jgi:hypothetical protein
VGTSTFTQKKLEEIDAILVGQPPAGLSVDESRALLLQVISDPQAPWHAELN